MHLSQWCGRLGCLLDPLATHILLAHTCHHLTQVDGAALRAAGCHDPRLVVEGQLFFAHSWTWDLHSTWSYVLSGHKLFNNIIVVRTTLASNQISNTTQLAIHQCFQGLFSIATRLVLDCTSIVLSNVLCNCLILFSRNPLLLHRDLSCWALQNTKAT